jgi:hypothetical protein
LAVVAADLLIATTLPVPFGVELLIRILLRKSSVAVVVVAFEVCKIHAVEKFVPVEIEFKLTVLW